MILPDYKEARKRTKSCVDKEFYDIDSNFLGIGSGKTYYVKTYGCQMNEHDSENIAGIMEDMSYTRVDSMDIADVIIVNTCAIRENAHNKAEGMLGRIKHLKETEIDDVLLNGATWAIENGCYEIAGNIPSNSKIDRGFYEKNGFEQVAVNVHFRKKIKGVTSK